MKKIIDKLTLSYKVLKKYHSNPIITVSYLEAIARIRFIMMEIASSLDTGSLAKRPRLLLQLKDVYTDQIINNTCTDFPVIGDAAGPAVYLLKVLVRQHGFHSLNKVFKQCQWIVPMGLHEQVAIS